VGARVAARRGATRAPAVCETKSCARRPTQLTPPSPTTNTSTPTTESDTDEQLLLHIPFTQKVKLTGIAFAAPPSSAATKGPKSVKLFVNRPHVGFSDAESTPAAAELSLTAADLEDGEGAGKTLPLKPARFTGVDVLSIFVESNQGDEETTVLSRLTLFGSAGDTFDVAQIKKIEEK
jgi:hypothetical protein